MVGSGIFPGFRHKSFHLFFEFLLTVKDSVHSRDSTRPLTATWIINRCRVYRVRFLPCITHSLPPNILLQHVLLSLRTREDYTSSVALPAARRAPWTAIAPLAGSHAHFERDLAVGTQSGAEYCTCGVALCFDQQANWIRATFISSPEKTPVSSGWR